MPNTHSLTLPPKLRDNKVVEDEGSPSRDVLIFFISGNPGLIGYYEPFLSTLRTLLDETNLLRNARFQIYGQNLAGFSDDDHEPFTTDRKPHSLEYQIQHTLTVLKQLRIESGPRRGLPYDDILLIGHSVGGYITLELFHRLLRDPSLAPHVHLTSGILLFPTIHHISSSPSGWKLNLLRKTPILGDNAYRIAQTVLRLCPHNALHWLVRRVLGFSAHGVETTTRWIKSRDGVWQALHMGMDEMKVIGEERWGNELWEIAHEAEAHDREIPTFFFFFGKNDHWVANEHRDGFIKRQKHSKRTRLIVDEGCIPHAFCIRMYLYKLPILHSTTKQRLTLNIDHSEIMAEKVKAWILEMYGAS